MADFNIEQIVAQVLAEMKGAEAPKAAPAPAAGGAIPAKSRVAMLTALENYEIKEYPIPKLGDDDILVKLKDVAYVVQTLTNSRETHSDLFH